MNSNAKKNNTEIWDTTNRFDRQLDHIPEFFKGALVDVMDTAETVKLWFDENKIAFTGADLAAFTAMVLEREKQLRDERQGFEQ